VHTGLQTNATNVSFKGNATYDVYFTNSESYSGESPDQFLMVWFFANGINPITSDGEGWSCGTSAPTFVEACTAAGSTQIGGKTFHRFVGSNGISPVVSYVPDVAFDTWEFDLNDFIRDATAEGIFSDTMYLQSVQAGFELIEGGAGLTVFDFYVDVQ
jgi:hypothetical protein